MSLQNGCPYPLGICPRLDGFCLAGFVGSPLMNAVLDHCPIGLYAKSGVKAGGYL